MTFQKFAEATIIGAEIATRDAFGLVKAAHRAVFDYEPKPGFLYVRSRMISSRCNDNHDEFPPDEIMASWRTAIGRPAFVNHHNETHKRMRGVIIDAALHEDTLPDGRPDVWIEALHEVDAKRFPKLAEGIINERITRTSMGCDVGFSVCSACNNKASTPAEYCQHIPRMKGQILYRHTASGKREGEVIREICHKLSFFENSFLVEPPADPTAKIVDVDSRWVNMPPRRAILDSHDRDIRDAISIADVSKSELSSSGTSSTCGDKRQKVTLDDQNIGLSQPSLAVSGASRTASLGDHVSGVTGIGAQQPVQRLLTLGEIARVQNDLSGWNGSDQMRVAPTVRTDASSRGVGQAEASVTAIEGATRPRPASRRTSASVDLGEVPLHLRHGAHESSTVHEHQLTPADHGAYVLGVDTRGLSKAAARREPGPGQGELFDLPPGARQAPAPKPQKPSDGFDPKGGPLSWDEIGERHPGLYGDPEYHGEEAAHADGEGIGWAAAHLAFNRAADPHDDDPDVHSLTFHPELVHPKHIDYARHGGGDFRVFRALEGYDQDPRKVPPLVLVHRHGVYQVADGHHRAEAAGIAGKKVRAYVAYSPHADEPNSDGERAPYHGADPHAGRQPKTAALHQGEPFRIQPKNGRWLVVDVKGKTRGEHATEEDARVHQATLYSSLPQAGDVSGNRNPESTPDTATEIVRARMGGLSTLADYQVPANCLNCGADMVKPRHAGDERAHEGSPVCSDCLDGEVIDPKEKPPSIYHQETDSGGARMTRRLIKDVGQGNGRHFGPEHMMPQSYSSSHLSTLRNLEGAAHKYPNPADHPFFKKYPVSAENVVASFKKADMGRKAQGMRWYSDAHLLAKALTPEDPGKAAGVLAAYSPKAAWPDNMFNAARSLHEGRALGLGEGASIMGQHQRTAQKIMDGEHHSTAMKSPKIGDFAHLIEHGDDSEDEKEAGKSRVVVDRHAMSVATGKRMTTKDLEEAPLHSRHYYEHVADTYRQAATTLSQELGEKIAPHQVQAVTWGVQQEQNQKDDEEAATGGAKGRATRTKNSWTNWAEHAKESHPDLHDDPPNLHARNPYESGLRVQSAYRAYSSLPGVLAYGETKAPAEVDTLRTESCPVCGESDSFDGDRCEVCHFLQPPSMFTDPDTGVAKQMDLKKEPFDQGMVGPNGEPLPDVDSQEAQQPMEGMPGEAGDQVADLFCPACGFSADTQEPMTNNDPAMPSGEEGLMEGDVCPQCEQATMLSPNDVGEMGGEVPQEIAGDADADAMPDDEEPDIDKDGIPDDAEPDVDADGIPDDAEPDEDQDGVPDDAEEAPQGPEEVPGEEDADPAAVEDEEPPQKGRKDNSRRASWRGHERNEMTKPNQTAGASSELATLRRTVAVQQEQLAVAGRQLHYLAALAGISGEFDAIKREGAQKIADIMNPAQPIPDPPGGAPTETTQQAEAPKTFDDPRNPGLTPGSTDGVPAAMTASPLDPGVTMPTSPYTQLVDPTQPVAGTETHVPLDQTKIETDVRVGDPMVNVDNPAGYGFPLTGPFAADGAASANTTTSPGMQQGRTMASIRLAKLRKSAGLVSSDVDELVLGSQIERTAGLSDTMIAHEINTLDSVVKAASRVPAGRRPQGGPLPKTAGTERRVPSLAGGADISTQASVFSGFDDGDASDLFVDNLS